MLEQKLLEILGYHIEKTFTAANLNKNEMQAHIQLAYYAKKGDWNLYWSTLENECIKDYPLAATELRLMNIVERYQQHEAVALS